MAYTIGITCISCDERDHDRCQAPGECECICTPEVGRYTIEDAARARGTAPERMDPDRVTPYEARRFAESVV